MVMEFLLGTSPKLKWDYIQNVSIKNEYPCHEMNKIDTYYEIISYFEVFCWIFMTYDHPG